MPLSAQSVHEGGRLHRQVGPAVQTTAAVLAIGYAVLALAPRAARRPPMHMPAPPASHGWPITGD
jgi:hypothetical protein